MKIREDCGTGTSGSRSQATLTVCAPERDWAVSNTRRRRRRSAQSGASLNTHTHYKALKTTVKTKNEKGRKTFEIRSAFPLSTSSALMISDHHTISIIRGFRGSSGRACWIKKVYARARCLSYLCFFSLWGKSFVDIGIPSSRSWKWLILVSNRVKGGKNQYWIEVNVVNVEMKLDGFIIRLAVGQKIRCHISIWGYYCIMMIHKEKRRGELHGQLNFLRPMGEMRVTHALCLWPRIAIQHREWIRDIIFCFAGSSLFFFWRIKYIKCHHRYRVYKYNHHTHV